jgi:hypothetical protein
MQLLRNLLFVPNPRLPPNDGHLLDPRTVLTPDKRLPQTTLGELLPTGQKLLGQMPLVLYQIEIHRDHTHKVVGRLIAILEESHLNLLEVIGLLTRKVCVQKVRSCLRRLPLARLYQLKNFARLPSKRAEVDFLPMGWRRRLPCRRPLSRAV